MGRTFLEHSNGEKLFNCAVCDTNLTNLKELISSRCYATTGPAKLFRRVVNLTYSEVRCRSMFAGQHLLRGVMCKRCKTELGFMYVFSMRTSQQCNEGAVLLERKLIVESKGFPDEQ
uniref:Protein yippee-like n=1 Tax=Anopheles minimus TaxID=112268 RepID=A0A182WC75_9DIPT